MDFAKLIINRHSVRHYSNKPIESEKLEFIMNSMTLAPSAGGLRAYVVRQITDEKTKHELAVIAANQMFIAEAPLVLVFHTVPEQNFWKYGERGQYLYAVQDATIAAAYAQLMATEIGLSSCWIGAFDDIGVNRLLKVPVTQMPVVILPIGYEA